MANALRAAVLAGSAGKPLASHLIPRIKCFCSHPDGFLIRLNTVLGLSTAFSGRRSLPDHGGIEPDRQRAAALERFPRHWARTDGASMARQAGQFLVMQAGGGCSCPPATTLDSRDESLMGSVQQSRFSCG